MKRVVFLAIGVLLAMVILTVGCAPKATPPAAPTPAPAPAAPTQNVTGVLKDVNTPDEPGKDFVTVQTPQGEKTFPITANTTFTLEGKACSLEQVAALDLANQSYNCTTVYGYDADGYEQVIAVDITKIVK